MARITDANLTFAGQEPKFSTELTQTDLMKSLAWYAQNKDKNDHDLVSFLSPCCTKSVRIPAVFEIEPQYLDFCAFNTQQIF